MRDGDNSDERHGLRWRGDRRREERHHLLSALLDYLFPLSVTHLKWPFYQFHSIFQFWRNRGGPPSWVDTSASSPVGLLCPHEVSLARDYSIWSKDPRPPWGVCLHLLAVPPLLTLRFCLVRAYSVSRRRLAVLLSLWMGLWGPVSLFGDTEPPAQAWSRGTHFSGAFQVHVPHRMASPAQHLVA